MKKVKQILNSIKLGIKIANENYLNGKCHQGKFQNMKSYIIRYKTSKTSTSIKSMIVEANDPIEAKEMVESYGMYVISCLKGE